MGGVATTDATIALTVSKQVSDRSMVLMLRPPRVELLCRFVMRCDTDRHTRVESLGARGETGYTRQWTLPVLFLHPSPPQRNRHNRGRGIKTKDSTAPS